MTNKLLGVSSQPSNEVYRDLKAGIDITQRISILTVDVDQMGPSTRTKVPCEHLPPLAALNLARESVRANLGKFCRLDEMPGVPLERPGFVGLGDRGRPEVLATNSLASIDAINPRGPHARLAPLLGLLGCPSALKERLGGGDGQWLGAATYLAAELIRLRDPEQPRPREIKDAAKERAVKDTLLANLANLLQAGVDAKEPVVVRVRGAHCIVHLAALATLHHDVCALRLMLQHEQYQALEQRLELPRDEGFFWGAGLQLAEAFQFRHRGADSTLHTFEVWDEFIVRAFQRAPSRVASDVRLTMAGTVLSAGFAQPATELYDRLQREPFAHIAEALALLFEVAACSGQLDLAKRLAARSDLCCYRLNRYGHLRFKGQLAGPLPIFRFLHTQNLPDDTIFALLDAGFPNGDGLSARMVLVQRPNVSELIEVINVVGAPVHAAVVKREAVAHALLVRASEDEGHQLARLCDKIRASQAMLQQLLGELAGLTLIELVRHIGSVRQEMIGLQIDYGLDDIADGMGPSRVIFSVDRLWLAQRCLTALIEEAKEKNKTVKDVTDIDQVMDLLHRYQKRAEARATDPDDDPELLLAPSPGAITQVFFERLQALESELGRVVQIHEQHAAERRAARSDQQLIAPGLLIRRLDGDFTPLAYCTALRNIGALGILLRAPTEPAAYDVASAFAHALALEQEEGPKLHSEGVALRDLLLTSMRSPTFLWGLLYGALEIGSLPTIKRVTEEAHRRGVVLDALCGSHAVKLLHLAARQTPTAFRAVLSCLPSEEAQAYFFGACDSSGDTLYHLAVRTEAKLLEIMAKAKGFRRAELVGRNNASMLTPIEEAALVGARPVLAYLWSHRHALAIEAPLKAALEGAARQGAIVGIASLLASFGDEPALLHLVEGLGAEAERAQNRLTAAALRALLTKRKRSEDGRLALDAEAIADDDMASLLQAYVPSRLLTGQAKWTERGGSTSPLQAAFDAIRFAGGPAKIEAALASFAALLLLTTNERPMSEEEIALCWRITRNLERRYFGRFFGAHFFAHRTGISDEQLLLRLGREQRAGSSRFANTAAPAILILRQAALQLLAAHPSATGCKSYATPRRYAVHLAWSEAIGSGFVYETPAAAAPAPFALSKLVRIVMRPRTASEPAAIISMYPIADTPAARSHLKTLVLLDA